MNDALETVDRAAGPVLVILVVAVVAYVALRLVGRLVSRFVRRRMRESGESVSRSLTDVESRRRLATVTSLVDWIFRLVIIVTAGLAVLLVLDLTPVIVVILVLLAVVAVVARDVIRDYAGGVLIVLENQFSIGDWVRVGNEYGEVEALSLRRTSLRTEGGDLVTIPNGDIRTVTNRTRGWARINVEINIADPAQVDAAVATIDQVGRDLAADPGVGSSVIEPPHFMMVKDISEGGICLLVWGRVRAADRFAVEGEYRRRLLGALAAAGVILVTAARVDLVGPETSPTRRTRAGRPT